MEANKKAGLGFWKRMYLALTDFRIYAFIQREKFSKAVLYFAKMLVLLSIALSISITLNVFYILDNLVKNYYDIVPKFSYENGMLDVARKFDETFENGRIIVDTDLTYDEFILKEDMNSLNKLEIYAIATNDAVVVKSSDEPVTYFFQNKDISFDYNELYSELEFASESLSIKIITGLIIFSTVFVVYIFSKFFGVLFFSIITYILSKIFGIKIQYGNGVRIVLYALTLPLIIESVSLIVLGEIPQFAYFTYITLVYVYIIYGLRALKIDNILSNFLVAQKNNNDEEKK